MKPSIGLKTLWAPWRMRYIVNARNRSLKRCLFCDKKRVSSDEKHLILRRSRFGFSCLNLFPYTNGHLLIVPYRHVGQLEKLTSEEWKDLFYLVKDGLARLKATLSPEGFNLGLNLGRVAGAGVPGHIHLHLVPRWSGDTNFMPTLSGTRVISQALQSSYRILRQALSKVPLKRRFPT